MPKWLQGMVAPTLTLWFCALGFGVAWGVTSSNDEMPKRADFASGIALPLVIASWVIADAQKRGRLLCYDYDTFLFFAWLRRESENMDAGRIVIVEGDIAKQRVDAIVNAANTTLLGGGGVDGAIHRAAGPELLEECRTLGGCPTGQAKITKGYNLPAKWVIHAVGPVWHSGDRGEDELLANCYRNSLALAARHGIKTIAFPGISTGAYRFPLERATRIAATETTKFLSAQPAIEKVAFVCFGREAFDVYQRVINEPGI